jgi:flagellar motor switch protein FliM
MGVWEIKGHDWSTIKNSSIELSIFWKSYFSNISVAFSKLYFEYTQTYTGIHLVSRQIVKARDYFENMNEDEILRPFAIIPHGEMGFIHIPTDMGNYLIHSFLGGKKETENLNREISHTDMALLNDLILKKVEVLRSQFLGGAEGINIQLIDEDDILLYANSFHSAQLVSIQLFSFQIDDKTFVFTVGMANRMLEQFVII